MVSANETTAGGRRTTYWTGTVDDSGQTLTGKWGYTKDDKPHPFAYTRVPPEVLHARPPAKEFAENRIEALWKYARTAMRTQVRRRRCEFSWPELKERREIRERYVGLLLKEANGQLTKKDMEESTALARLSTCDDVRCFYLIYEYRLRSVRPHFGITCDGCRDLVRCTRLVCMECDAEDTFDFCDRRECIEQSGNGAAKRHCPTHDFVKIRVPIVDRREISRILRKARAGLQRARNLLEGVENRSVGAENMPNGHDEDREQDERVEGLRDVEDDGAQEDEAFAGQEVATSPDSMSENEGTALTCLSCNVAISWSCLYCIDCPEEHNPFICGKCEYRDQAFDLHSDKSHLASHNLVPCKPKQMRTNNDYGLSWDPWGTDQRLNALERKLEGLTSQLERIGELLYDLASTRRE